MTEVDVATNLSQQDVTLSSLIRAIGSTRSLSLPSDLERPDSFSNNYLLSLTSKSLNDIRELPAILNKSKVSLDAQLSSLCSQHVASFVQVHQATSSFPASLSTLDDTLQSIIDRDLPALSEVAQQFTQRVQSPLEARDKAQNLLTQYEISLKDLLDIPRLLMTCVRASHPVEALQLAVHMMRFKSQKKHGNTIRSLQEECQVHLLKLREDLLRGLGARGLRLPAAKRLISLLRKFREVDIARTDDNDEDSYEKIGITDSYICLSYLQSRWSILEELGSNSSAPKSSSIISSQLATWRDTVSDTCGIAQALFPISKEIQVECDELAPSTLISSFSRQSLHLLQQLLANCLPSLPEDSISLQDSFETFAAIHTQLSYSAASLSRQGVDISRLVSGHAILHQQVVNLWKTAMIDAKKELEKARIGKDGTNSSTWMDATTITSLIQEPLETFLSSDALSTRLAQFPDIRLFVNGILKSYNALLSFAPVLAGVEVLESLDSTLQEVIEKVFITIKEKERVEVDIILDPITSSNAGSRYYERDAGRQREANLALLARLLLFLCKPISVYLRDLIGNLFSLEGRSATMPDSMERLIEDIEEWGRKADGDWQDGERSRRDRVRVEEEKLAAEEEQKREEERRLAAEMKRREEEEAEKTRIARAREEEEERQRARKRKEEEEEEERKRLLKIKEEEEEAAQKERLRKVQEQEEEKKRTERLQVEAAEKERLRKVREEEEDEKRRVNKLQAEEEEEKRLAKEKEEEEQEENRRAVVESIAANGEEGDGSQQQEEENRGRTRSIEVKETEEDAEAERLKEATSAEEETRRVEVEMEDKARSEEAEAAQSEADGTVMDAEVQIPNNINEEGVKGTEQPVEIGPESKAQIRGIDFASKVAESEPKRTEMEDDIVKAEGEAIGEDVLRPKRTIPDSETNMTNEQSTNTSESAEKVLDSLATAAGENKLAEFGNEKKNDKPANRLAEKLRQRQEQRQKRAEGSNPAQGVE